MPVPPTLKGNANDRSCLSIRDEQEVTSCRGMRAVGAAREIALSTKSGPDRPDHHIQLPRLGGASKKRERI